MIFRLNNIEVLKYKPYKFFFLICFIKKYPERQKKNNKDS